MSQIADAIEYIHSEKLVHLNISPHNIYITPNGQFKLSGFGFSYYMIKPNDPPNSALPPVTNTIETVQHFGQKLMKSSFVPFLDFSAPEYVLRKQVGMECDIFSFGCVYFQLIIFRGQKKLMQNNRNIEIYKTNIEAIRNMSLTQLAKPMADAIMNTLSDNPKTRLDMKTILSQMYLFGDDVSVLKELNSSKTNQDPVKKAQFLRSIPPFLPLFPDRVLFQKVLPPLLADLKDTKMCLFALPNVIFISQKMNNKSFSTVVLPTLSRVFMVTQPAKIPLLLLENFELLMQKVSPVEQKDFVIPFLVRCLDSPFADVQIEALKNAEKGFSSKIISSEDFFKTILPKIENTARTTQQSSVRVNAAVCLGKSLPLLDTDRVVGIVIPVLEQLLLADQSSQLVMTAVGVYNKIAQILPQKQILAARVIPTISPIAFNKSLNRDQFTKYLKVMRGMIDMIEAQMLNHFDEAEKLEEEMAAKRAEEEEVQRRAMPPPPTREDSSARHSNEFMPPPPRRDDLAPVQSFESTRQPEPSAPSYPPIDDLLSRFIVDKPSTTSQQNYPSIFDEPSRDVYQPASSVSQHVEEVPIKTQPKQPELDSLMNKFMMDTPTPPPPKSFDPFSQTSTHTASVPQPATSPDLFEKTLQAAQSSMIDNDYDSYSSKPVAPVSDDFEGLSSTREKAASKAKLASKESLNNDTLDLMFDRPSPPVAKTSPSLNTSSVDMPSPSTKQPVVSRPPAPTPAPPVVSASPPIESTPSYDFNSLSISTAQNNTRNSSNYGTNDILTSPSLQDSFDLKNENITDLLASLGPQQSTTTTAQRNSYFDEDENNSSYGAKPAIKQNKSDLDDLLSRFMH